MVIIYALRETLDEKRARLSEAVHLTMCEVFKIPQNKRFQRFIPMEKDDFLYADDRSSQYTVIEIHCMEGRSKEVIKQLIYRLFDRIEALAGIVSNDVEITVLTQPAYCWGYRGVSGDDANLSYSLSPKPDG